MRSTATIDLLRQRLGGRSIETIVILGTGLGEVARIQPDDCIVDYRDLPDFPQARVSGHDGRLVLRTQGGHGIAFLLGRAHFYENGDARAMAGALSALAECGAKKMLVTCASGSTRADLVPGALVLLRDHINFSGINPLIGVSDDRRFVPMSDAYDGALAASLHQAAKRADIPLHEGIYMWFSGPSFETPAEVRMAKTFGADLLGMSTVPEVILARYLGLRVAGLSIVTNHAAGLSDLAPSHQETKRIAAQGAEKMAQLIAAFLEQDEKHG